MTLDDARPSSSKVCSKDLLHLTSMATDGPMASSCLDTGSSHVRGPCHVTMTFSIGVVSGHRLRSHGGQHHRERERERERCFKEFKEFSFCAVNAS
jgi:hypothetical protein